MTPMLRPTDVTALALASVLVACQPAPVASPTASPTPSKPPPPPPPPIELRSDCDLSLPPPPPGDPPEAGPVYVLVNRVGLLRIDDDGVSVAIEPRAKSNEFEWDIGMEMVASAQGELWLSDWSGVRVVSPDGEVRQARPPHGAIYKRLVVRSPTDVWGVTSDIEWSVDHFDGERWRGVGQRSDFPGYYDDNKFSDLAVNSQGVWVVSANGVWRGVDGRWERVSRDDQISLRWIWTYRDQVLLATEEGLLVREAETWQPHAWQPEDGPRNWTFSDLGIITEPGEDSRIRLHSILGEGCGATSERLAGSWIRDIAIDGSGRVWAASDRVLTVLTPDGGIAAQWMPGALPKVTGEVVRLAVVGAGPERLLPAAEVRTYGITGRAVLENGRPLPNARVELCTMPGDEVCPRASLLGETLTGPDGSFHLDDIPENEFWLRVFPPNIRDCEGPRSANEIRRVATARDCPAPAGQPCDVGELVQCRMFEFPPPPI
jgi:hypothetical protein